MFEKDKKKEYMEEYRKNQHNNLLKKLKENDKLKSVEVNLVTNFIKDKVESSSDAEVYTDDNYDYDDDDSEEDRIIGFS